MPSTYLKSKPYYYSKENIAQRKWKKRNKRKYKKRNNYNYMTIPTQVAPNNLFVKLPYSINVQTLEIPAKDSLGNFGTKNLYFMGNGIVPVGLFAGTDFPAPIMGTLTPPNLANVYNGIQAYAHLYEKCTILANSFSFQAWNESVGNSLTNVNLQVVLLAMPYNNAGVTTPFDNVPTNILMSQKGCISRMISGSGGKNYARLSKKIVTKKIMGWKDTMDQSQSQNIGGANNRLADPLTGLGYRLPGVFQQWLFMVRVINPSTEIANVTYTIRSTANCALTQRRMWVNPLTGAAPPPV